MPCTRTGIPLRSIPAGDGHVICVNIMKEYVVANRISKIGFGLKLIMFGLFALFLLFQLLQPSLLSFKLQYAFFLLVILYGCIRIWKDRNISIGFSPTEISHVTGKGEQKWAIDEIDWFSFRPGLPNNASGNINQLLYKSIFNVYSFSSNEKKYNLGACYPSEKMQEMIRKYIPESKLLTSFEVREKDASGNFIKKIDNEINKRPIITFALVILLGLAAFYFQ